MIAEQKPNLRSKVIEKSPIYYGWVILVVGTLGIIMSSPGQTYSFSIFIEEFIRDLGLSRSLVSSLYTIGTITGSLALPFIGRQIDLRGNRTMVVVIAIAFGAACIYMSTVSNAIMLMVGIVFMRMLGQNSISIVSSNVINQWWVRRRGSILGIVTLVAAVLGTGLFPNLINWLIPQFGWRMSYVILGGAVIGLMVPLGYTFFRERPELYGLLPDGEVPSTEQEWDEVQFSNADKSEPTEEEVSETIKFPKAGKLKKMGTLIEENWTRAQAVRTKAFWLIIISIAAHSMLGTGLTFHIVSIFADNGLSSTQAAQIFIPMSITTALLGVPLGWVVDRVDAKYLLSVSLVILTAVILLSSRITSVQVAILFGVMFGVANGFQRVVGSVIYANYFGRKHLGSIQGLTSTFGATASGIGPLIYGVGRDLAGNYTPSLWLSAIYPIVMAVLVLFMKRPKLND